MKKSTKEKEPQYFISATNMQTINYKVYYMSGKEKIFYSLIAFVVGAAVGYLFFGGLAKDEYGYATTMTYALNIIISGAVGIIAAVIFVPVRTEQILQKRKKMLTAQFRDMLEGLATALNAGNNVMDAFSGVYEDLKVQYEEGAFILRELENILGGMQNNVNIEELLEDFGKRSGIPDIISFADVFQVCYRKGGNICDVIRNTREILNDKLQVRDEIETTVTSSKTEQNMMIVMPIALIGIIKYMSPEFAANFATPTGVMATVVAIGCFIAAYFMGKKILDIKI